MRILIGGDYCPQDRISTLVENKHFEKIFGDTIQLIKYADISILNLECPVVYNSEKAIIKAGPNLKGPLAMIEALKYAGVNIVTLANNHFLDYGKQGALNTFKELKRFEIGYLGADDDLNNAAKPLIKEIDDITIALFNVCESEFSIARMNAPGSNPIDLVDLIYRIKEIRNQVDYIILIVHGGHEHYQLPSPRMKKLYRFFIDEGVDVVVNHHQHCYSGYEKYKGKYIFYGLGNYCFDNKKKRDSIWNEGILLELNLDKTDVNFELHPFIQCNRNVGVRLMNGIEKDVFSSRIAELNAIINDDEILHQSFEKWIELNYCRYKSYLSPYTNRYLRYLCRIGILPAFLNRNRKDVLYDMIKCESHNDIITKLLER